MPPFQLYTIGLFFYCLLTVLPADAQRKVVLPFKSLKKSGITISHTPGKYEQDLLLQFQMPDNIRLSYTTNGYYSDSITQYLASPINIRQTTAYTWRLHRNGRATDTFFCGTYLIREKTTLPITTLIIPPTYLFDPVQGIYVGGGKVNDEKPWGNCWKDMEVPAFFEFFRENGDNPIHQHCGLKIFGGYTRGNPEKSMKVTAKKKYGPGKFKGRIFPLKDIRTFNALVLRVSGSDFMKTRFQDMLCASIAAEMRIDHMTYQPSILFVNGEYWGIHNVREKIDLTYLEKNHGADSASTDILHFDGDRLFGSSVAYANMIQDFKNLEPNNPRFIEEIERRMDVTNYFNYMVLQIYLANVDMRGNVKFWRAGNLDGRFRWIFYDADLGFQAENLNFLAKRISPVATDWYNPTQNTFLLRKLLSHPTLRDRFIRQYCLFSATLLSDSSIQQRINTFHDWLAPEMPRHLNRRTFKQSVADWEKHVENLRAFSRVRHKTSMAHLAECFQLKKPYQLQLTGTSTDSLNRICINGYPLPSRQLNGTFFGEIPLDLSIQLKSPFERFVGWSDGEKNPHRSVIEPKDSVVQLTAKFAALEKSTHYQQTFINCVHAQVNDTSKPWVSIRLGSGLAYPIKVWETVSGFQAQIQQTKYRQVVIAADTSQWRKQFPDQSVFLIQDSGLSFASEKMRFGIADRNHYLLDSVGVLSSGSDTTDYSYYVRSEAQLIPAAKPNWHSSEWGDGLTSEALKAWLFLAGGTGLGVLIALWLIRRKRI
jgi:hypothetical protein